MPLCSRCYRATLNKTATLKTTPTSAACSVHTISKRADHSPAGCLQIQRPLNQSHNQSTPRMPQSVLVTVDFNLGADKASSGVCGMHNQRRNNLVDHKACAKVGEELHHLY